MPTAETATIKSSLIDTQSGEVELLEGDSMAISADSVALYPFTQPNKATNEPMQVEPQRIYGEGSTLHSSSLVPTSNRESLIENAPYQILLLGVVLIYAALLHRYFGEAKALLVRIVRDMFGRAQATSNLNFGGRYSYIVMVAGALFMGVLVVKFVDISAPNITDEHLYFGGSVGLSTLFMVLFILLGIYQRIVGWVVGAVTLSRPFIKALESLRAIYSIAAVATLTPLFMLYILSSDSLSSPILYPIIIVLCIYLFLYLKEGANLFISKKVSLLHWFLYLCTVEILPISLIWLTITR